MKVSKLTNRSKSLKVKERQSSQNFTQEENPEGHKPELEVRDINDAFRLLYRIYTAEKSDSMEDLQLFYKEASSFFQFEKRSAKDQKGLNDCLQDKKSMKEFMTSVRNFIIPLVFGRSKNLNVLNRTGVTLQLA